VLAPSFFLVFPPFFCFVGGGGEAREERINQTRLRKQRRRKGLYMAHKRALLSFIEDTTFCKRDI